MNDPIDKCQMCYHSAKESEFEREYSKQIRYGGGLMCPICGSFDIEPDWYNGYEDDDEDIDWTFI